MNKHWKALFPLAEKFGLHVVPNHYYYPIPDLRRLDPGLWGKPSEMVGVDLADGRQRALLDHCVTAYQAAFATLSPGRDPLRPESPVANAAFGPVDLQMYYCMIRDFKPRKIIEVGSGFSTRLALRALEDNATESGSRGQLTCIDPYAAEDLVASVGPSVEWVRTPVQRLPVARFEELAANDVLFIDSSHVLQIGSDVCYEYLEVLPRLKTGVVIHSHDIFLPANYRRDWVLNYVFWNEQYVLQAFLTHNDKFEVLWSSSYMHMKHPDLLKKAFGEYPPGHWPASFWYRRKSP